MICQTCQKEFVPKYRNPHRPPQKFCGWKCIRTHTNKLDDSKFEQAIARYKEGFGFKLCAREFGIGARALRARLKKLALLQNRKANSTRHHPLHKAPNGGSGVKADIAFQMQKYAWDREWSGHKDLDQGHWIQHPERRKWLKRKLQQKQKANRDNYYFAKILRSRIYCVLKGIKKSAPTLVMLGCSIDQLKAHLQSQFKRGMSWKNYGLHGWHIDHKIPCDSFDLREPEQQRKCFHYSNLQPMWAVHNWRKNSKIVPTQPELLIVIKNR